MKNIDAEHSVLSFPVRVLDVTLPAGRSRIVDAAE
jgi:hypothetical protein